MWFQLQIEHCSTETAEAVSAYLEELGALSVMLEDQADTPVLEPLPGTTPLWPEVVVQALFADMSAAEQAQLQVATQFPELHSLIEKIEDCDWERVCMADFKAQQFGEKLWICPTWLTPPDPTAVTVMLDPGLSFGTGTHPTTGLCLTWLAKTNLKDHSLIDYGCGSGILSLAAMKLGAKPVFAVDIDNQALEATGNNAKDNQLAAKDLHISSPQALQTPVDYLLANILLAPLLELKTRFYQLLKPGGHLVVSGILEEQAPLLTEAYSDCFKLQQQERQEEWCLLVFRIR